MKRKQTLFLGILVVIILIGLVFYYFSSKSDTAPATQTAKTTGKTTTPAASTLTDTLDQDGTQVFEVVLDENKISSGPSTITVKQNQGVAITFLGGLNQEEAIITVEGLGLMTYLDRNNRTSIEFKPLEKGSFTIKVEDEDGHKESAGTIVVE